MARLIYPTRANRLAGVSALALMIATSGAAAQNALPTGGSVASGKASIGVAGPAMTVTQSTQRAIVNWNSFSIEPGASVTFAQPSTNSAILNRVTGTTTSSIAGQLNANGEVFLVNPNGVAITPTGSVRVGGGFVASTLAISDSDFSNGYLNFKGDGASGPVSVAGSIGTSPGGFVGLVGRTVSVSGDISVPLGKIALGSGEAAALDLTGDNFLRVAAPTGATTSDGQGLVDVSGKVRAAGGAVVVKAATAADAVRNAINIPGSLAASSARGSGGSIILGGGPGGDVNISGRVATSGRGPGGAVKITGRNVNLKQARVAANGMSGAGGTVTITGHNAVSLNGAQVTADGATGGGAIRVGGDFHGAGDILAAGQMTVDSASTLSANATLSGDGGSVAVWSNALTDFAGYISARGGPSGGDGGFAEVSANPLKHGVLGYSGLADLRAPMGATGALLLDPYNITISTGADAGGSFAGGVYTPTATSTINNGTLDAQLASSNVVISTGLAGSPGTDAGNITVSAPVTWGAANSLTLSAANNITLSASLDATGGGNITMNAGGYIHIHSPINPSFQGGNLTMTATNEVYQQSAAFITANNVSATSTAGPVVLTAGNEITGSITGSGQTGFSFENSTSTGISVGAAGIRAPAGSVALIADDGDVTQAGPITASALYVSSSTVGFGSVTLTNAGNAIGTLAGTTIGMYGSGPFSYTGNNSATIIGSVTYNTSQPRVDTILPVTSAAGITAAAVTADNTGGDLIVNGTVASEDGNVVLSASGAFTNNVGSAAITSTGGIWQVYSSSPTATGEKFNGLDSLNTAVWNTTYPTAVTAAGNRYIFAFQPTITVTAGNLSKTYGTDVTSTVATDYTITGLQPAVAGAYAADTAASVYSGAPTVTSGGSPASASVAGSPYAITVATGAFAVTDNYALSLVPGTLTVSPISLTWSVADANSTYGTLATLGAATLTGVLAGDTVTPTVGAFSGATPIALAAKTPVGTYSERVTAISNSNYTLAASGNTPGTLTISPKALTWSVADANSTYGTLATLGAATLTGVVAGDTVTPTVGAFSGATPITLAAKTPVGTYLERVTAIDNSNYILATSGNTPGVVTISPLAITYAVANANSTYGTLATIGATTLNGVLAGDTVTPTVGVFSGATPITLAAKTPVGTYSEQVTAIDNSNYTLAATGNTPGVLTISPLAITYAVANSFSLYGSTPVLGATTLSGVLSGDVVTPTTTAFSGATPIVLSRGLAPGVYAERVTALSDPNYAIASAGNSPGALIVSIAADPGQVPGIVNWTPPASGGDIDLGGFELQLPALPSSCESANLPDPNRFNDPKAALEALSKAMEKLFEVCQNLTPSTIADALDAYAARLEVLAPRLPPQLRNLPQIIHKAAQDIRAARTPGEAVKAVVAAIGEVHKAIALLRAEDPVFGRIRATTDRTVDATLNAARVSLLKAAGL